MTESKSVALPTWRIPTACGVIVYLIYGAGEENRTLTTALEGQGSTIELHPHMVVGEGFEPSKSLTTDLQSVPFGRSGTPPILVSCYMHFLILKMEPMMGLEPATY